MSMGGFQASQKRRKKFTSVSITRRAHTHVSLVRVHVKCLQIKRELQNPLHIQAKDKVIVG